MTGSAILLLLTALQGPDSTLVIHAGRILDLRTAQVEQNVTLVIRGGKIAAKGRDLAIPANATVVDARALTLLAGLIDTHVHLTIGGRARENAAKTLQAGFTTVADLGSPNGAGARLRKLIDADSTPGPRLIAGGSWIGGKGGVCEFGGATIRGAVEADARAAADIAAGANLLKLCITDWLDPVAQYPDSVELTRDEIDAVAARARQANVPLAAHAIGRAGVAAALRAGVRLLAHTPVVDAAGARAIAASRTCVSTTMTTLLQAQSAGAIRTSFQNLRNARVRLVFGTDAGVLAHGSNAQELGDPLLDLSLLKTPALVIRQGRIM